MMGIRKLATAALLLALTSSAALAQQNQAGLSWDPSAGATNYEIHCGTMTGVYNAPNYPVTTTGTQYLVTFQAEGIEFFCAVKACNAAGCSGFSNEVSSFPRPEGSSWAGNCAPDPGSEFDVHCDDVFSGYNFAPDIQIALSGVSSPQNISVQRDSSRQLIVSYDIPAGASSGPVTVTMTQGTLNPVVLTDFFNTTVVVLPPPPANPVWQ